MQKIINGITIFSGVVALGVVGLGGYVFIRKDAIIDGVKSKVMGSVLDSVTPDLGGIAEVMLYQTLQDLLHHYHQHQQLFQHSKWKYHLSTLRVLG